MTIARKEFDFRDFPNRHDAADLCDWGSVRERTLDMEASAPDPEEARSIAAAPRVIGYILAAIVVAAIAAVALSLALMAVR